MRIDLERPGPPRRRSWIALLNALIELAGDEVELLRHVERPWASITFAGTRHTLTLAFRGVEAMAAGEAFIVALPEHEFEIPHQIVVEAEVTSADHALLPEPMLTLEVDLLLLEQA